MEIEEILKILTEAQAEPFPISQVTPTTWVVDTGGLGDIYVDLRRVSENGYSIVHVAFRNETGHSATNTMGSVANKVLWSVIDVVEQIPSPDIFVFYPVDDNQKALAKKSSIYGKLLLALVRYNKVARTGTQVYPTADAKVFWAMPQSSAAIQLEDSEVVIVIEDALATKLGG